MLGEREDPLRPLDGVNLRELDLDPLLEEGARTFPANGEALKVHRTGLLLIRASWRRWA